MMNSKNKNLHMYVQNTCRYACNGHYFELSVSVSLLCFNQSGTDPRRKMKEEIARNPGQTK